MGQTPTPMKLASELTREAGEDEEKQACKLESQLELDPTLEKSGRQTTALNDMAIAARRILSENPNIVQRMLEHSKSQLEKPLRLEEFQIVAKPIEN